MQVLADGTLRIIDRRKDCFKLENGEYIAPGRIEAALLASSFVETLCIVGNSSRNYLIGLLVPKRAAVLKLARDLGILGNQKETPVQQVLNAPRVDDNNLDEGEWRRIFEHERLRKAVLQDLARVGNTLGLPRVEIPAQLHICTEIWSSENGLLTDSLKLRRRNIETYYRNVIDLLYGAKMI